MCHTMKFYNHDLYFIQCVCECVYDTKWKEYMFGLSDWRFGLIYWSTFLITCIHGMIGLDSFIGLCTRLMFGSFTVDLLYVITLEKNSSLPVCSGFWRCIIHLLLLEWNNYKLKQSSVIKRAISRKGILSSFDVGTDSISRVL